MAKLSSEKSFAVVEPNDDESAVERLDYLTKIVTEFEEHLSERASHYLGYPSNQNCEHFVGLSQLLQFNINNCGDPFTEGDLGMHTKKFEVGVLEWFAKLWEIEKEEYWGYVTNGGTEGNLHGILMGRELLPNGVLYTSQESHYSLFKIARMYRMDCETISSLATGEMDYADLKRKLLIHKDRPAIINVIVGTTFKGALDDLDVVIETLEDCGYSQNQFYIHCDAAIFGFITPFLNQVPKYTFKKPIGSMSVSGHKFMGTPMPCGVQITRKIRVDSISQRIEYIASLDNTIAGSRNGHSSMFLWYGLNVKGLKGLQKDFEECLKNARYLRDRLKDAGISTMLNEMSNAVIFERPPDHEFVRHWQIQCLGKMAHIVIMPHVSIEMLDKFLHNLVQKRGIWYESGKVEPPCLAEDIGICNCACSLHAKG